MSWVRLEGIAYWSCFVAVFLAVAVWETRQPKHDLSSRPERRWRNHGALLVIALVVSTVLLRLSPVALAIAVAGSRSGILNGLWLPVAVRFALALVLLDLSQYLVHWTFHHVPLLWRVHAVHHSDADYDVSTAGRFHPLEVLCTQAGRLGTVALLAPPVGAVVVAEILSMILNLTVHANASLPSPVEKMLRWVLITPDLHRIHHSEDMGDQQRNLGQTFPWWDRLFGTYRAESRTVRTGLKGLENYDRLGLGFLLAEPFREIEQGEPEVTPNPLT
jgi:sterol desaturase/sphingolipid hydroxylase (fatty acid hydroxylase superfamily)